jgi:hypothetical protein
MLILVTGAVVAVYVVITTVDSLTPSQSGPRSSSYATAPDGLAAYADLLEVAGHRVSRVRMRPGEARLDPGQTVVMLDPDRLSAQDVRALRDFVSAGGELVAGGQSPQAWLGGLIANPPSWSPAGSSFGAPLVPVPENNGVTRVSSTADGAWVAAHGTLPAIGTAGRSLLTVALLGSGRVALLADASPLQNQLLAQDDNAALGLSLAGGPHRPVAFIEGVHGFGGTGGLAALPVRWKWLLGGLILAALVLIAARIRRLGPPEPATAAGVPPRRAHVVALASALRRTGDPSAASSVQEHARALVLRRAGLGVQADDHAIAAAASRLGLDANEARVVAGQSLQAGDVLTAGRALAKLSGEAV